MIFYQLFEAETSTYTYLLADELTREAILIDTVLECVERDFKLLKEMDLKLKYIVDTHIHADHITGSGELKNRTGAKTCISSKANVTCIDLALNDGDELHFGSYSLEAIETQGHTDSCMSFKIADMIFTGDVLLIRGTGRTDFQQGSSNKMFQSIREKIFILPSTTKIYPGHDYKGFTSTTIELEKKFNPRISINKTRDDFQKTMSELNLAPPKKLDIAVPANLKCGILSN
jgi:glyoxylase-like metal-dependent hydrolase (beta-lactamase superfamily II)